MGFVLRALRGLNDVIERVTFFVSAVLVASMVLILFGGAVTRFLTGIGYNVVMELPPMLMPWLVFPLAGVLLRRSSHIAVDFLPDRLGARGRRILRGAISALIAASGVLFLVAGWEATALFMMVGQVTEMEWEFPIWWIYLSFPVGFAILTLFALENLLAEIAGVPPAAERSPERTEA